MPAYLGAVGVEVDELAVGAQCGPQLVVLNLVRNKLHISEGTFLFRRRGNSVLATLSLGVGQTPLALLLGLLGLLGFLVLLVLLADRLRGSGGRLDGRAGLGGGRGSRLWLGLLGGRSSSLCWKRNNRLGSRSSDAAGPRHGLSRLPGLLRLRCRSASRGWSGTGLFGHLGLWCFLLGNLWRDLLWLGGRLNNLGLAGDLVGGGSGLDGGLNGGRGRGVLGHGAGLLELLVNSLGIQRLGKVGSGCGGDFGLGLLRLGFGSRLLRGLCLDRGTGFLSGDIDTLFLALVDVSHDVIEKEVASGLLCENEGLDELLGLAALVGDLSDNLDDDVRVGGLGVDVGNADLAVLEVKPLDGLLDVLREEVCS